MTKKLFVTVLSVALILFVSIGAFSANKAEFRLSVDLGYHMYSDSDVSNVFDDNMFFGFGMGYKISPKFELYAGLDFLSTEDALIGLFELDQTMINVGAYLHLGKGSKMTPKLGAGVTFGSVTLLASDDSGVGFWFAGALEFKAGKNLFTAIEARYLLLDMDPTDWGGFQIKGVFGIIL